ncbi:SpoIIE family protein phosphatase [Streptomyces sp. MS19]|uniref:fused response regulator/phosphatase n=1 Tax=Streptomyces sp. MS19 TaxID=3385972 RepID=UPI00399F91D3
MAAGQDPPQPGDQDTGDTGGGIPVAVVVLDGAAVIAHWNSGAAGLFEVPRAAAVGRRAVDVMPVASARETGPAHPAGPDGGGPLDPAHRRETIFGTDMTTFADPAAGWFSTRGTGAKPYRRQILWWAYPLRGPGTARVLLLAADSAAVRRTGRAAFAPVLGPHGERADADRLHDGLTALLPMPREEAGHVARQVVTHGYPFLELRKEARWEPVLPGWGATAPAEDDEREDTDPDAAADPAALRERLAVLRAVGAAAGPDPGRAVEALGRALVPRFADIAGTYLRDDVVTGAAVPEGPPPPGTRWHRVTVERAGAPGGGSHAAARADRGAELPAGTPFADCVTTGRPVLVPRVTEAQARTVTAPFGPQDIAPQVTRRSLLAVPLKAGRSVLGFVVLLRHPERPGFTEADLVTGADIADRAGLILDNARLRSLHAEPPEPAPPRPFGCTTASRLLPGTRIGGAAGEWSDVIRLPGCRTALVAGRVLGRLTDEGPARALAAAHRYRTAIQTLAALDADPAHLLRALDDLARRLGDLPLATCLFAVHDPIRSELRVATAGHLPPVLIRAHGPARALDLPAGAPIGVGGVPFTAVTVPVLKGDRLVLCTDGLAEVRGRGPGTRLATLCDIAVRSVDPELPTGRAMERADATCDAVARALSAATAGARDAGTTLLTARLGRVAPGDVAFWRLGLDAAYVPHARHLVRGRLREWGLAAAADTAALLVSELVTNALRHARRGPVELRLVRADTLVCEVTDDGHERPALLGPAPGDESGRGLQVVSRLARSWGSGRTDHGTTVWFEQDLPGGRR